MLYKSYEERNFRFKSRSLSYDILAAVAKEAVLPLQLALLSIY